MADVKRKYNVETTLTAQKVCQLIDDGKINDLPLIVKHDEIIGDSVSEIGTAYTANGVASSSLSATVIDDTHVFVTYRNNSNLYAYGFVLVISGTSITRGNIVQLTSVNSVNLSCSALDSTHVLLTYNNSTTSGYLWGVVLIISGTTITVGTLTQLNSVAANFQYLAKLNSTKAIVVYASATGGYLWGVVLTISGTTISAGAAKQLNSAYADHISIAVLSEGSAIVSYRNNGASYYLYSIAMSISGTTITNGSNTQINAVHTANTTMSQIDSTKILLTYLNTVDIRLWCVVLTLSGTTISIGALTQSSISGPNYMASAKVSSSIIAVSYVLSGYLYVMFVTIGSGLTFSASTQLYGNTIYATVPLNLLGVSSNLFCNIFLLPSTYYVSANAFTLAIATPAETRNGKVIGVSLDTAGNVQLKGKCKALSGLTPGSKYYFDASGVISTTATGTFLGVALSATELSIPEYLIS